MILGGATACAPAAPKGPRPPPRPISSEELAEKLGLEPDQGRVAVRSSAPGAYLPSQMAVRALDGRFASLADVEGHWALVDFFATWAAGSQFQMEKYNALYLKYKDKGLRVVGIALDREGAIMVKPFIETLGIEYPIYLAVGETREGQTPYGFIETIPLLLLIDPQGRMRKGYVGPVAIETVEKDFAGRLP